LPHRSLSRCVLAKQTQLSHGVPCRLQTLSLFDFFQVSLNSDPKVVAGKIAHCSRSDCPPTVLAIGQGCLNQAIKVCHTLCILLLGLDGKASKAHTFCVPYRLWPLPGDFACSLRHTMTWHLTCPVSQHSVRTVRQPGQQGAHLCPNPWCLHDLHHRKMQ